MSKLRFDGQVAIVTGAGRGIGRAHALLLASRGAAVVVNDVGRAEDGRGAVDPEPAQTVVEAILAAGGRAVASTDDVTTEEGAARLVHAAVTRLGGLHAVVNNAGVVNFAPLAETSRADMAHQLAIDPLGGFNVTRAAWHHLAAQGYGRIVFTSSAAAFGGPVQAAYGAAKASLIGLGRSVAAAGAGLGIVSNVVLPYAFTRMTHVGATIPPDVAELRSRLASPDQVAALVALLAHDACPGSGELYAAGGGQVRCIRLVESGSFFDPGITPERLLERWDEVAGGESLDIGDLESFEARFYQRLPGWPDR